VPFRKWKKRFGAVTVSGNFYLYTGATLLKLKGEFDMTTCGAAFCRVGVVRICIGAAVWLRGVVCVIPFRIIIF